jgi:hypothetical protein
MRRAPPFDGSKFHAVDLGLIPVTCLCARIERLKTKMLRLTEYTVSLIVVFSLQTMMLPMFMLWLFGRFVQLTPSLVMPAVRSPLDVGRRPETPAAQDTGNDQTS